MAQSKVNDFFSLKKKNDDVQPAKRRKIEGTVTGSRNIKSKYRNSNFEEVIGKQVEKGQSTSMKAEPFNFNASNVKTTVKSMSNTSAAGIDCNEALYTQNSLRSRSVRKTSTLSSSRKSGVRSKPTRNVAMDKSQQTLTNLVIKNLSCPSTCSDEAPTNNNACPDVSKLIPDVLSETLQKSEISEEITSFADDHDRSFSGLSTPRKRTIGIDTENTSLGPRTRHKKIAPRRLSDDSKQGCKLDSAKKKLELSSYPSTSDLVYEDLKNTNYSEIDMDKTNLTSTKETCGQDIGDKSSLIALVSSIEPPPCALSPLARTPERSDEDSPSSSKPMSPKLKNLSQKLKALSKMNGQALKNRLKQNGKLSEVKEKLNELGSAVVVVKEKEKKGNVEGQATAVAAPEEPEKEKSIPAHQRFEHLVTEGSPTLTLPFSYRLLDNTFQAMDTVVSMMHNRSEMCTFSKLRVAVQNITKKNFDQKAIGQIKTVTPEAYTFRQEKNIPNYGKKVAGYQLTVEPNLPDKGSEKVHTTKEGKSMFTATSLLKRKHNFQNRLVEHVKQYHKEFLSSLNPPIVVDDDKITRWHPRFQLDKVPEVHSSSLPQPPETLVYHTAKDILEKQRGKLNSRVEQALTKVVSESKQSIEIDQIKNTPSASSSCSQSSISSSSSSQSTSSLKGIPPALLAKIRAKEAQKMQDALTRDPAEDNKTKMMGHLPDMMRILRSYFITEKKPALPLDSVYKKLQESYKSGISLRDVELHIGLMKEFAPELITLIEIKRGKFLKLDKNVDIQAVSKRILNQVKARK